ncbi:hypothetical protein SISNIDRAFT_62745 [Sistotremastrum niveocremeum HHB9708]|uniref:Uncharacterized protein n=1 Tax=Sistotremastrum niveocremeum HHB9708 TaxID=1314777 RepID=A0A164VKL1_9AGAM|nr:hypothetical protein SISNIDRAFT_62745 [Sistotremastrum niveocremeum HHB9708]
MTRSGYGDIMLVHFPATLSTLRPPCRCSAPDRTSSDGDADQSSRVEPEPESGRLRSSGPANKAASASWPSPNREWDAAERVCLAPSVFISGQRRTQKRVSGTNREGFLHSSHGFELGSQSQAHLVPDDIIGNKLHSSNLDRLLPTNPTTDSPNRSFRLLIRRPPRRTAPRACPGLMSPI